MSTTITSIETTANTRPTLRAQVVPARRSLRSAASQSSRTRTDDCDPVCKEDWEPVCFGMEVEIVPGDKVNKCHGRRRRRRRAGAISITISAAPATWRQTGGCQSPKLAVHEKSRMIYKFLLGLGQVRRAGVKERSRTRVRRRVSRPIKGGIGPHARHGWCEGGPHAT